MAVRLSAFIITSIIPMITGTAMVMGAAMVMMITTITMTKGACHKLGLLPSPLAGEGWRGDASDRMPPSCPSPASGGGDAGALAFTCERSGGAMQ